MNTEGMTVAPGHTLGTAWAPEQVVFGVVPPFFDSITAFERIPAAIQAIAASWGSDDPQADFNADFIVNSKDIEYILRELP